ncbi:MAG TPA: hypothetical protein VNN22_11780, partial [Verrucomicrobiae bacterium]|nr:hypothetical protein [Verrucomicrobiae bacterium]
MTGSGANYVFWDYLDPTAKLHAIMADVAQQLISPVQISQLAVLNGSNRLDTVNIPIGLNGFVEGILVTNQAQPDWSIVQNFTSTKTAQSIFVNAAPLPTSPPDPIGLGGSGGSGGPGDPGGGTGTNNVPLNSAAQLYRLRFPYAWNWP